MLRKLSYLDGIRFPLEVELVPHPFYCTGATKTHDSDSKLSSQSRFGHHFQLDASPCIKIWGRLPDPPDFLYMVTRLIENGLSTCQVKLPGQPPRHLSTEKHLSGTSRALLGHLSGTFSGSSRAPPGHLSGTSRAPLGHLPGTSRAPPGHLPGTSRAPPRHLPGISRAPFGRLSDTSRAPLGHLPGTPEHSRPCTSHSSASQTPDLAQTRRLVIIRCVIRATSRGVNTYIHTYIHTCMHAYIHTSIHIHTCIHT